MVEVVFSKLKLPANVWPRMVNSIGWSTTLLCPSMNCPPSTRTKGPAGNSSVIGSPSISNSSLTGIPTIVPFWSTCRLLIDTRKLPENCTPGTFNSTVAWSRPASPSGERSRVPPPSRTTTKLLVPSPRRNPTSDATTLTIVRVVGVAVTGSTDVEVILSKAKLPACIWPAISTRTSVPSTRIYGPAGNASSSTPLPTTRSKSPSWSKSPSARAGSSSRWPPRPDPDRRRRRRPCRPARRRCPRRRPCRCCGPRPSRSAHPEG